MKFKAYNNIKLAEGVTKKSFLKAISTYDSIDDALLHLSDEELEFYLINIDTLHKDIIKIHEDVTLGYSPGETNITKNIKYKGQYISLEFDQELRTWFPAIRFRSIMSALKYIKRTVDYVEDNI